MISEDNIEKRKETVLLSKLGQVQVEKAVSKYPYKCFYSKNIRIQLQKTFDLIIDEEGDLDRIMGRRIGSALVALEESGHICAKTRHRNSGILYKKIR